MWQKLKAHTTTADGRMQDTSKCQRSSNSTFQQGQPRGRVSRVQFTDNVSGTRCYAMGPLVASLVRHDCHRKLWQQDADVLIALSEVHHDLKCDIYTVNHKKRDILFLTTLANLNRFLQFLYHFNREEILHVNVVKFTTSP